MENKNSTQMGANTKFDTKKLVSIAMMAAVVVVVQALCLGLKFLGVFSLTLTMVPIVVGAALYGWKAGAIFGFLFGALTLFDAALFWAFNPLATIAVCLLKGAAAGASAGLAYKLFAKKSDTLATVMAAVVSPIVNTGIFIVGCLIFFVEPLKQLTIGTEWEGGNFLAFLLVGIVGVNFIIEFVINVVLSPVILRITRIAKKTA